MKPRTTDTTEEHRPPSSGEAAATRALLLSAFPEHVAVVPPRPGEVVGRAWFADAGVRDREISTRHARFFHAGGGLLIEDAGSRNGTFVNGERLGPDERRRIEDGDVIRLGKTLFVHRAAYAGDLAPAPPLGPLVGPWGLVEVRAGIARIRRKEERNVLIEGETGTGKELCAAAVIHALGRSGRFVNVNVAGVPATLFEGQLFGWVKGAFSGSAEGSKGVIREHDRGAVFLDEIGELDLSLQPKLLRVIENREVMPAGASKCVPVDVAIVAATNRPVDEAVAQGRLRQDLVARFTGRITLPPLAERAEDLYAVLDARAHRCKAPLDPAGVEVEAVERLMLSPWKGNVRDLDRLLAALDPGEPLSLRAVDRALGPRHAVAPLTREALEQALAACSGNQSEAARRLGIGHGMMVRRVKEWGLGRQKG
jgi:transcriptional regulator of acetoin/glycerol metabolism